MKAPARAMWRLIRNRRRGRRLRSYQRRFRHHSRHPVVSATQQAFQETETRPVAGVFHHVSGVRSLGEPNSSGLPIVKRIVILAALACTLSLPTQASAATKTWHYTGTLTGDPAGPGVVSFDLVKKGGKRKARNFAAENIPSSCDNDTTQALLDFTGLETAKVRGARFHFKGKAETGAVAKFAGRLSDHWRSVHGRVSWNGLIVIGQTARDCRTGKVKFTGSRTEILTS
jgi:hypothetical protein